MSRFVVAFVFVLGFFHFMVTMWSAGRIAWQWLGDSVTSVWVRAHAWSHGACFFLCITGGGICPHHDDAQRADQGEDLSGGLPSQHRPQLDERVWDMAGRWWQTTGEVLGVGCHIINSLGYKQVVEWSDSGQACCFSPANLSDFGHSHISPAVFEQEKKYCWSKQRQSV